MSYSYNLTIVLHWHVSYFGPCATSQLTNEQQCYMVTVVSANDKSGIQSYSTNTKPIFQTPFYYNSSPAKGDQLVYPSFSTFQAHQSTFRGLPRHP